MPKASKRARRRKRTVRVTLIFTPAENDLLERAAARSLEPRSTWAYRRLVFEACKDLGLPVPEAEGRK